MFQFVEMFIKVYIYEHNKNILYERPKKWFSIITNVRNMKTDK